jgi:hypothetical protein
MKKLRATMGLSAEPPTTVSDKKGMADFRKVMEECGFDKLMRGGKK